MACAFLLLLLLGQVYGQLYPPRKYYYIDIKKTWQDARAYCRENYHDIAIFHNSEDIQLLSRPQPFSSVYAWIGLSDDETVWRPHMGNAVNSWMWSATGKPSTTGYQNFAYPRDPDYYEASELCVIISNDGLWRDIGCTRVDHFVCFTETGTNITHTYVASGKTWADAVAYCRLHHTDLVMIEDAETNIKIYNSKPDLNVWIGLSREAWAWADGSPVTYSNWQGGKPIIPAEEHRYCAKEEEGTHQWITDRCANLLPFICHREYTLMNRIKVNIHSSANLADPSVQAQILQKLVEVLRARGYHVSKLSWSIQPQREK